MLRSMLTLVGAITLVAGCASSDFVGRSDVQLVRNAEMSAPTRADLTPESRPYVVGPGDTIAFDVFGLPDLSAKVVIDGAGNVSLPLIGVVEAAGRTASELADLVTRRLRDSSVRDPRVIVNVTEVVSQVVTVDGEVRLPGAYPVQGRMTLTRAIARAQGVTEFARQNYILVFRSVDRREFVALYDLRAIRQGMYADPEVYANDIVYVSESRARRLFKDILQASPLISAPVIALAQR